MTPLIFVTVLVILLATPLSFLATYFCWALYREDRSGIVLALAAMVSAATVAGVLLSIPTLFFITGRTTPFGGQLILLAIDILLPSSLIVVGYLRWLER